MTQDGDKVYNERKTAKLTITKKDSVRNGAIPGVKFELYEEGVTKPADVQVTNAEGKASFEELKQGVAYEVVEITPEGYKPLADPIVYRITPGDEKDGYDGYTYSVENEPLGTIEFRKVSDRNYSLAGAEFRLTGVTGEGDEIEEMIAISDGNGIVRFENVPIGRYQIMESSAPVNYEKDEAVYFAEITGNPNFDNLFGGLMDEDGVPIEGNKVINRYIGPIPGSGTAPIPGSGTAPNPGSNPVPNPGPNQDPSPDPDSSPDNKLPQTGQDMMLMIALSISGLVFIAAGVYIYRNRRVQKNEK